MKALVTLRDNMNLAQHLLAEGDGKDPHQLILQAPLDRGILKALGLGI